MSKIAVLQRTETDIQKADNQQPRKRGNPNITKYSWKKGQSGNPKGRPKKQFVLNDCLRSVALRKKKGTKKTHFELVAEALFKRAEAGNVDAGKYLCDRLLGKIPDALKLTGHMGQINVELRELLEIVKDDPERARALATIIRAGITDRSSA